MVCFVAGAPRNDAGRTGRDIYPTLRTATARTDSIKSVIGSRSDVDGCVRQRANLSDKDRLAS
jgi:hypothetical protein